MDPREARKREEKQSKILTELLARSDNQQCADCACRGTRWCSVNIGCFLCIRCAGLHRKLGTHISKIKSTSLDNWPDEWLQFVASMGNSKVNQRLLSRNNAPAINSQDDNGMESFIRNKYEKLAYSLEGFSQETKVEKKSNINPLRSDRKYHSQMETLISMGFHDQSLCQEALEKYSGNVERAIEHIIARPPQSTQQSTYQEGKQRQQKQQPLQSHQQNEQHQHQQIQEQQLRHEQQQLQQNQVQQQHQQQEQHLQIHQQNLQQQRKQQHQQIQEQQHRSAHQQQQQNQVQQQQQHLQIHQQNLQQQRKQQHQQIQEQQHRSAQQQQQQQQQLQQNQQNQQIQEQQLRNEQQQLQQNQVQQQQQQQFFIDNKSNPQETYATMRYETKQLNPSFSQNTSIKTNAISNNLGIYESAKQSPSNIYNQQQLSIASDLLRENLGQKSLSIENYNPFINQNQQSYNQSAQIQTAESYFSPQGNTRYVDPMSMFEEMNGFSLKVSPDLQQKSLSPQNYNSNINTLVDQQSNNDQHAYSNRGLSNQDTRELLYQQQKTEFENRYSAGNDFRGQTKSSTMPQSNLFVPSTPNHEVTATLANGNQNIPRVIQSIPFQYSVPPQSQGQRRPSDMTGDIFNPNKQSQPAVMSNTRNQNLFADLNAFGR